MSAPREGRWFAEPRKPRRTLGKQPWWWIALLVLPQAVSETLNIHAPMWVNVAYGLGCVGFVAQSLYWTFREALALHAMRHDRSLSEGLPGIEEFAVEIVFSADRRYLGTDSGILWFDHGLLHFNGKATSFVIDAEDIVPRSRSNDAYKNLPRDALRLRVPKRAAFIRVRSLWSLNRFRFRQRLRTFLEKTDGAKGLRQWPPLTLYGADVPTEVPLETVKEIGEQAARTGTAHGVLRVGGSE